MNQIDINYIINLTSGDSAAIPLEFRDQNLDLIDLTNANIFLVARDKNNRKVFELSTINGRIELADQQTNPGEATANFEYEDTFNVEGSYDYDITLIQSSLTPPYEESTIVVVRSMINIVKDIKNA